MRRRGLRIEDSGLPARSDMDCGSPLFAAARIGRAVPCPPPIANGSVLPHPNGAHGVTRPTFTRLVGFCFLLSVFGFRASGQSYSINWSKIAGGGGTSTNGQYSLSGTIGQPDAGGPMTNGQYSITGGFWSLIQVVQTAGAPLLTITYAGNQAIVSWPVSATGWTLQTNSNLATGTWSNYAGTVVNNSVTNSPPMGSLFFRLKQ